MISLSVIRVVKEHIFVQVFQGWLKSDNTFSKFIKKLRLCIQHKESWTFPFIDWLIDWLIDWCLTPYRQYLSLLTAATFSLNVCIVVSLMLTYLLINVFYLVFWWTRGYIKPLGFKLKSYTVYNKPVIYFFFVHDYKIHPRLN